MNYEHPTITIECPLPGHYCISGHRPLPIYVPGQGHIAPPGIVHLSPEIPDDALLAVLEDRRARREEAADAESGAERPKASRRGRAGKTQAKEVGV